MLPWLWRKTPHAFSHFVNPDDPGSRCVLKLDDSILGVKVTNFFFRFLENTNELKKFFVVSSVIHIQLVLALTLKEPVPLMLFFCFVFLLFSFASCSSGGVVRGHMHSPVIVKLRRIDGRKC